MAEASAVGGERRGSGMGWTDSHLKKREGGKERVREGAGGQAVGDRAGLADRA